MELAISTSRQFAEARVEKFHRAMGPFVVAVETTRMPMIFTDRLDTDNPVVFANNAALALTGYDQTGILGLEEAQYVSGWQICRMQSLKFRRRRVYFRGILQ